MEPKIIVQRLDKIGDRDDFSIRVVGPGQTECTFPLSVTGTVSAIWNSSPNESADFLVKELLAVSGIAAALPVEGFWFDSYNSGDTLRETLRKIRNFGIAPFVKNRTVGDSLRSFLGDSIFSKIECINRKFTDKYGFEMITSLDCAFEFGEAKEDLNNPPQDLANFLYRVCILSGIIDHLNVRLPKESKNTPSLTAFRNWLNQNYGLNLTNSITEALTMIKNLRKQYPIHDNYIKSEDGKLRERKEITRAKNYFQTSKDYPESWNKVLVKFRNSLDQIEALFDNK